MVTPPNQEISARFENRFSTTLSGPRTIGREAEYPVVKADGQAADVTELWDALIQQGDFGVLREGELITGLESRSVSGVSYSLEVGRGTIEVITGPCKDLFELEALHEKAVQILMPALLEKNWKLLGYGIQPLSAPDAKLMSPKMRYGLLHELIGPDWLWFCTSASDQVQIDVSQSECIDLVNLGNLMAPVIIAFCANSSVYSPITQKNSLFLCGREGEKAGIFSKEFRHGMLERPYVSFQDFVDDLFGKTFLFNKQGEELVKVNQPFSQQADQSFDAFLIHDHYIWNSARARSAHGTIEFRPACQQPWGEHMANSALCLGIAEAHSQIIEYLQESFGDELWPQMHSFHKKVVQSGLSTDEPVCGFFKEILDRCRIGLENRGLEEESFLTPLYRRLEEQKNPAQVAREIFEKQGRAKLIQHLSIKG